MEVFPINIMFHIIVIFLPQSENIYVREVLNFLKSVAYKSPAHCNFSLVML